MEPTLRSAQVLKQEAEEIGFEGKDILEYVKEQQKLDREERAAWREAQKMQAQADVELAKIRAEAEEKRRADEIKVQMAKIEAEKELTLREMELKPRIKLAPALQQLHPLVIKMPSPRSYHLLLMRRTNLTATCYALNAMLKMPVGRRTHGLLS